MFTFKCPVCSTTNSSDAKFCRHCGYVFSYNTKKKVEYNSSNEHSQNTKEKSNTGCIWA